MLDLNKTSEIFHWKIIVIQEMAKMWNKTDAEVAELFDRYDVLSYLEDEYDWLQHYGMSVTESEIKEIIEYGGGHI